MKGGPGLGLALPGDKRLSGEERMGIRRGPSGMADMEQEVAERERVMMLFAAVRCCLCWPGRRWRDGGCNCNLGTLAALGVDRLFLAWLACNLNATCPRRDALTRHGHKTTLTLGLAADCAGCECRRGLEAAKARTCRH